MIVEMGNKKFEVKRITHLKAIETITTCYFVILYLSWNSVTSLVWCHFWIQILSKKSILAFELLKSLIKPEDWYLSNKVAFLSILLSSFDFHEKHFCGRICNIIIKFLAKFHQNLFKKIWSYCIYIKLDIFWMSTTLPCFWTCPNSCFFVLAFLQFGHIVWAPKPVY